MLGSAFAVVLALIRLVVAAPWISFPINSQVPPVAQASQLFLFTYSESTFSSTAGTITYTLSGAPSWLQVNSANRTLSGTPGTSDIGATTFQLVGSDSTGSTSMTVTLVVLDNQGIQLGDAVLPQLAKVGPTSSPDALLLYPSQAFTIKFDASTFVGTSTSTIYYATSGNNTPLPSWLDFSEQNLEFTGTSPPIVNPTSYPQIYPVRLIASDVVGFAGATAVFEIVVGYDVLYFNVTYQTFAVKSGQYFQTPSLLKNLNFDDRSAQSSDVASVTSNAPSWLTLDSQNISLAGIPPDGATSQNITVTVTDANGDVANSTINLDFSATSLFNGNFSTVNATLGQPFNYSIGDAVESNAGVNIAVNLGSAASWLTYDHAARTLSGTVPSDGAVGIQNVQITASTDTISQTETLPIRLVAGTKSPTSTSFSATAEASSSRSAIGQSSHAVSTPTLPAIGNNNTHSHARRDLAIVLGILLPILLLLILLLLVLCCLRRRRRRRDMEALSQKQISRPILEEAEPAVVTEISAEGETLEKERTRTPEPAPRIELPWAPDSLRKSRARLSKKSSLQGSPLIDATWGGLISPSPPIPARSSKRSSRASSKLSKRKNRKSQDPQDLIPIIRKSNTLNYSRKRIPFRPTQSRTMQDMNSAKRSSRPMSLLSSVSSGVPSRLSGMGHGAGGFGPPGYMQVQDSWQNTRTSFARSEDSRMDSVDLERFPRPPRESTENTTGRGSSQGGRPSLRLVDSGSLQRSSLSEERQRYVRDRARDRLESAPRFSSSWSMRPSSRDSRGVMEKMRSPGMSSSVYPEENPNYRNTWRTYSKSSSVGGPRRPETIVSEDEDVIHEPPRRPPPLMLREHVSYSSGQFNSAESTGDSAWEDEEDLEESIGPDGQRRWQVSASNSPIGSPLERPLDFGEGGLGSRPGTSRGYPPPLRGASSGRRWRLGERRDKRPVSVTEGDLQRSQGSQRGNLAFV